MTVQTSYTQNPPIGRAGSVRNGMLFDSEIRWAEGANVVAGLAVIGGTAGHQALAPAATFTTKFLGMALEDQTALSQSFPAGTPFTVARKGVFLVAYEPDTVPTADTPAFARHTANGAGKLTLGAWRANADSGNAVAAPGAMFRQVFQSEGMVELELTGVVN